MKAWNSRPHDLDIPVLKMVLPYHHSAVCLKLAGRGVGYAHESEPWLTTDDPNELTVGIFIDRTSV